MNNVINRNSECRQTASVRDPLSGQRSLSEICGEMSAQVDQTSDRLNRILDMLIGPRPTDGGKNPQPVGAVSILENLNNQVTNNLDTITQIEKAFGV